MKIRRIFLNLTKDLQKDTKQILDAKNAHYLNNVLRLKAGDIIQVFDGLNEYSAIFEKNSIVIQEKIKQVINEKKLKLAVSVINKDRLEWLVEKATELNVDEIFLLNFKYSKQININYERLNKIAIESAKQSKRTSLPNIYTQTPIKEFIKSVNIKEWCFGDAYGSCNISSEVNGIIIGPEGGAIDEEINCFDKIKLSDNILRTETAAIAGVCFLQKIKSI